MCSRNRCRPEKVPLFRSCLCNPYVRPGSSHVVIEHERRRRDGRCRARGRRTSCIPSASMLRAPGATETLRIGCIYREMQCCDCTESAPGVLVRPEAERLGCDAYFDEERAERCCETNLGSDEQDGY